MNASSHSLRVVVVWRSTVVRERTFTQTSEPRVTVGEGERNHFDVAAPGLPEAFEMFERTADGYRLRFTDRLEGSLNVDGEESSLEELVDDERAWPAERVRTRQGAARVFEMDLRSGDWGLIRLGDVKVFFQLIEQREVVAGRGLGSVELPVLATVAAAALLHVAVLMVAFLGYEPEPDLKVAMGCERCWMELAVEDVQDPFEEQDVDEPSEDTSGKKAGGEEGKFGDEDAEQPDTEMPPDDGELVEKIEDPTKVGVLEALSDQRLGQGAIEQVFAKSDGFSSKMDVAFSGDGKELEVGRGAGGVGVRGLDKGGGGDSFGRAREIGKVDTGGVGTGGKIGPKKRRKAPEPKMSEGEVQTGDFCDKGDIRRVVAAKANAVKYCYERQLQQKPELAGKIIAQWKIGLDGEVSDAGIASSTVGDRAVENCIARTISRMRFEKPKGGICVINYPFVFSGIE
ncbi:MAG: AgmX/PglI C-terminal domain-containing protein [Persicimonas sp.]